MHRPSAMNARERQRRLYDDLWDSARTEAMSADLIRYRIWLPHLRSPAVDVGAGDALLMRTFPHLAVVSIDVSDVGMRRAGGPALVGVAEDLPLMDGAVRTVVLSELLEHAEDPVRVLSECRRVLAAEGRLLLSTPLWPLARAELLYHWARIRQRPTLANIALWDPHHERRYRLVQLVDEVHAAGFEIEETVPLFGSASTAALYGLEPLVARLGRTRPRIAQHLTAIDLLLRPIDAASGVAMVCRRRASTSRRPPPRRSPGHR